MEAALAVEPPSPAPDLDAPIADAPAAEHEVAPTEPSSPPPLHIALKPLRLRSLADLDSVDLGELVAGQHVHVLEETKLDDVYTRAHVADTAMRPLGWVTSVTKDGHPQLSSDPDHHHHHENLADDHLPEWVSAVKRCVLFDGKHRSHSELHFIHQSSRVLKTHKGETIYAHGDAPSMLYLVHSGLYRVHVPNPSEMPHTGGMTWARDYGPGDNFGACELLSHMGGRQSTITVVSPGRLWGLPHHVIDSHLKIPPPARISGLAAFVQGVRLFSKIAEDPAATERMAQLLRGARQVKLAEGDKLCAQGDPAREVYVLQAGHVRTSQADSDFSLTMHPPESFGESALFAADELRVRQASIVACAGGATVLVWSVSAIETLVGFELQAASIQLYDRKMIESVKIGPRLLLSGLSKDGIDALLRAMCEKTFNDREVVSGEGDFDGGLFVIKKGEATVQRTEEIHRRASSVPEGTFEPTQRRLVTLATLRHGDCFGELSLIPDDLVAQASTQGRDDRRSKVKVRRRTSVLAHGPLTVLFLPATEEAYREHAAALTASIEASGVGADATLVMSANATGTHAKGHTSPVAHGAPDSRTHGRIGGHGSTSIEARSFEALLAAGEANSLAELSVNGSAQLAIWASQLIEDVVAFTSTAAAGASGVDAAVVERVLESGGNIAQLMARTATVKSPGKGRAPGKDADEADMPYDAVAEGATAPTTAGSLADNISEMAAITRKGATKAAAAVKKRLSVSGGGRQGKKAGSKSKLASAPAPAPATGNKGSSSRRATK